MVVVVVVVVFPFFNFSNFQTPRNPSKISSSSWTSPKFLRPLDTAKCCVASIAAWETLLKGVVPQWVKIVGDNRDNIQETSMVMMMLLNLERSGWKRGN